MPGKQNRKRSLRLSQYFRAFRSVIRTSPRSIALGASIGIFVAFTPTVGFQMILAIMLAVMLNASAITASCMVWINNPYTLTAICVLTHEVGHVFTGTSTGLEVPHLVEVLSAYDSTYFSLDLYNSFQNVLNNGGGMFGSMLIGGIVVGLTLSGLSYPLSRNLVSKYQRRMRKHNRRQSHNRKHRSPLSKHIQPAQNKPLDNTPQRKAA